MAVDSAGEVAKEEKLATSPSVPTKPAKAAAASKISEDEIREVARKLSDQSVQNYDADVWGVLTAISNLSRKRPQGMNIILTASEHCFGRCVEDSRFRIESFAISAKHCTISTERTAVDDGELNSNTSVAVFIKDTSTNGTYLNWTKLEHSAKTRLHHGDIISFVHPPNGGIRVECVDFKKKMIYHVHRMLTLGGEVNAFAFVYREASRYAGLTNDTVLKRKSEDFGGENKRHKGIGIGAPEGPISLDDVRSLQRSNTELRQQLESHVHTIETLRSESRATIARHENELKDLNEKVSSSFLDKIKDLERALDAKQKEIDEYNTSLAELRGSLDDLKERLQLSNQTRADADELINSQKATISELETQLSEERNLRREEREKAEADLKSALHRAHLEAQEDIKRQADFHLKQHKEQQEVINKLQECEKESRLLMETLRSKLEDSRENLVMSEKKVRQLEVQLQEEQVVSANWKKKSESLDAEVRRMRKELESEKVAREEAWAKVSTLELEIAAAIRDISIEKQRFQGARERIILRETQLRAFYSTTEEISALFSKQQEQLKAMQKTLEDEENYSNSLLSVDLNQPVISALNAANLRVRDVNRPKNNTAEASTASTPRNSHATRESSDDATTEKHDCEIDGNTQDLECTSSGRLTKEFVRETEVVHDEDPTGTERVPGTESQAGDVGFDERGPTLHKCSNLAGETMQLDDEPQIQENLEPTTKNCCSESRLEDTENCTIRTADLLTSEVAGSWAASTAPSMHGENESPNADADAANAPLLCSDGQASGSQSNCGSVVKLSREHEALNAMIEIVAPEFKEQFMGSVDGEKRNESVSDAETEEGSNESEDEEEGTDGGDDEVEDDDNEVMIEDSVG